MKRSAIRYAAFQTQDLIREMSAPSCHAKIPERQQYVECVSLYSTPVHPFRRTSRCCRSGYNPALWCRRCRSQPCPCLLSPDFHPPKIRLTDRSINQRPNPNPPTDEQATLPSPTIEPLNQTTGGGVHSSPRRPPARGCSPTPPSTSATSSPPCWPRTCCTLVTCRCSRSASRPLRVASASTLACGSRGRFTRPSRWTKAVHRCSISTRGG